MNDKPPPIIAFPVAKLKSIMTELEQIESLSKSLLKWYVPETDLEKWEDSPVPMICEIYTSANKLSQFLTGKLKEPTPEELVVAAAMQMERGVVLPFIESEVIMISSTLTLIVQNKMYLKMKHNISYEVH